MFPFELDDGSPHLPDSPHTEYPQFSSESSGGYSDDSLSAHIPSYYFPTSIKPPKYSAQQSPPPSSNAPPPPRNMATRSFFPDLATLKEQALEDNPPPPPTPPVAPVKPQPRKLFTFPPKEDLTLPSRESVSTTELQISFTKVKATSTAGAEQPRVWTPMTLNSIHTRITFCANGEIEIKQVAPLPRNAPTPTDPHIFRNDTKPMEDAYIGYGFHQSERLDTTPYAVPVNPNNVLSKVVIPRTFWKVDHVEAVGDWTVLVIEIKDKSKSTKRKKGKGKEKEADPGQYYHGPKIAPSEACQGFVPQRGASDLPAWNWGAKMAALFNHGPNVNGDSSEDEVVGKGKQKALEYKHTPTRHLISIRVLKNTLVDVCGTNSNINALLASRTSSTVKALYKARLDFDEADQYMKEEKLTSICEAEKAVVARAEWLGIGEIDTDKV